MRWRTTVRALAGLVAIGLVATPALGQAALPAHRVVNASPPPTYKYLTSISAVSADDVWAVGQIWYDAGDRTLIQHFDGTGWTRFPSPNPSMKRNELDGVTVIAPDDAWAVGVFDSNGLNHPMILHWNGKTWSQVPDLMTRSYDYSGLTSVVALSASDVWAVGYSNLSPLILHWDGTSWSRQDAENGGFDILEFDAITAISPKRLWLIGNGDFDEEGGPDGSMAQRWDGTEWTVEYAGGRRGWFSSVYYDDIAASSDKDVWVVGGKQGNTLVLHWTGAGWTRPHSFPTYAGFVGSVVDRAADDVWMVGGHDQHSVIWHYDGSTWTTSETGLVGNLDATDSTSADDVWAVGVIGSYPGGRCLIEHWDGDHWAMTKGCAGYRKTP